MKSLLVVLLAIVGLPASAFLVWDAIAFQPWLPDIRAVIAHADAEDRAPPALVRRLIAVETNGHADAFVSMHLVGMPPFDRDRRSANQHFRHALWTLALKLHLRRDERDALYATLAWNGIDHGLDRDARRRFGKPLHALDAAEAATVVANLRSPTHYAHDPARLAVRRDFLLARMAEAP